MLNNNFYLELNIECLAEYDSLGFAETVVARDCLKVNFQTLLSLKQPSEEGDDMSGRFYLKVRFQGKSRAHIIRC